MALGVSAAGGEAPFGGGRSQTLLPDPDGAIMTVNVRPGPSPRCRHRARPRRSTFQPNVRSFEMTPDGERFVGSRAEDPLLFTLVTNWPARVGDK